MQHRTNESFQHFPAAFAKFSRNLSQHLQGNQGGGLDCPPAPLCSSSPLRLGHSGHISPCRHLPSALTWFSPCLLCHRRRQEPSLASAVAETHSWVHQPAFPMWKPCGQGCRAPLGPSESSRSHHTTPCRPSLRVLLGPQALPRAPPAHPCHGGASPDASPCPQQRWVERGCSTASTASRAAEQAQTAHLLI